MQESNEYKIQPEKDDNKTSQNQYSNENNNQNEQEQQQQQLQRMQIQIIFMRKWQNWLKNLRKEREQALKVFHFQNQSQNRILYSFFKAWTNCHNSNNFKEKSFSNSINSSKLRQQNFGIPHSQQYQEYSNKIKLDNNDDVQMNLMKAIYERKLKAKVMRAVLAYSTQTKKFHCKMVEFYANYIQNKYFAIVKQYKVLKASRASKQKLSSNNVSNQTVDKKNQSFQISDQRQRQEQKNVKIISKNQKNRTFRNQKLFSNNSDNSLEESQRNRTVIGDFLQRNRAYQQLPVHTQHQQGFYQHSSSNNSKPQQPSSFLKQSRNSQHSHDSQFQSFHNRTAAEIRASQRKFRAVMQVPSLSDLDKFQQAQKSLSQQPSFLQSSSAFSQTHFKPSQTIAIQPFNHKSLPNQNKDDCRQSESKSIANLIHTPVISENNGDNQRDEDDENDFTGKRNLIFSLLTKLKLTQLNLLQSEEFEGKQEYTNYKQKIKKSLILISQTNV